MITSINNKTIKEIAKLNQKKYRRLYQASIIYNDKTIEEAVKCKKVLAIISAKEVTYECPIIYVTNQILEKLHPNHHSQMLAVVSLNFSDNVKGDQVLVLDNLTDPGNVGSIIRSAVAFGIKDIVIAPHCVDILSPKIIISSAGSIFHTNLIITDVYDYLSHSKLPIVTSFLDEPTTLTKSMDRFNLVIGNEQNGIDKNIKQLNHENLLIPIKYESLNASVAAGILLYNLCVKE